MNSKIPTRTINMNSKAGIYRLINFNNGKEIIDISLNLAVTYNRLNFLLKIDAYDNREIQSDYNKYGINNFSFEVVDYIEVEEDSDYLDALFSDWQSNRKVNTVINQEL